MSSKKKRLSTLASILFTMFIIEVNKVKAADSIFELVIPSPPDPHAQLNMLYEDSTHHPIMEFDEGKLYEDEVFFYDGKFLFDIDVNQAKTLASSEKFLEQFVDSHKLSRLPTYYFDSSLSSRIFMSYSHIDGTKCQWPYPSVETIVLPRRPPLNLMFVRRLEKPVTSEFQFWCERGPGIISLTTNFEAISFVPHVDYEGNILIAFTKPASVFKINQNSYEVGYHVGPNIVVFPSALSEHLLTMAADAQLDPQEAVELLEAEIRVIDSK